MTRKSPSAITLRCDFQWLGKCFTLSYTIKQGKCGFTLIELLIASLIFSIVILSVYSTFNTAILSYRKIDSSFETYQVARLLLNRIELDLKNVFIYAKGDSKFQGSLNSLSFFSLLDSYREGEAYLDLCRIKYETSEAALKRICYKGEEALKKDDAAEGEELVYEIKEISWRYASLSGKPEEPYDWQDSWPGENQAAEMPLAVKINLFLLEKDKRSGDKVVEFNKTVSLCR